MTTAESTPASTDVMARLRDSTREAHTAAERHPLQAGMVRGALPVETYADYLAQLLVAHRALESALRDAATRSDKVAAVFDESRCRVPDLESDLASLGRDAEDITPLPAASKLISAVATTLREDPVSLLGPFYVLEGSTNGGRFISKAVRKGYGFEPGKGDRYLDPYGDEQPQRWAAFKTDMGGVEFTPDEIDRLITSANLMFDTIAGIGDDLVGQ